MIFDWHNYCNTIFGMNMVKDTEVKNTDEEIDEYKPLYMEEIFIVNLYGTEEEIELFYKLLQNSEDIDNQVIMVNLIERIKRNYLTKMNWLCCSKCQHYDACRINWYRGEKNQDRHCCSLCENYKGCHNSYKNQRKQAEHIKSLDGETKQ